MNAMSNEEDIVERLLEKHFFSDGMMAARSEADADLIDKYRAERMDAAAEITKLRAEKEDLLRAAEHFRAERDAAVQDMRERCAKEVEPRVPRPCDCDHCYCGNLGDAEAVAGWDADAYAAKIIRALPDTPGDPQP